MHGSVGTKKDGIKKSPPVISKKVEEELELRPEYSEKIKRIEKANKKPILIKNIDDLLIDE